VLRDGYAPLGLQKGDRLEPHSGLPNIEAFETISEFPVRVLLWRATSERMTHHRNPLFNPETGITPNRTCALDWLHTLSLGCFQMWCGFAMHRMFGVDFWRTGEDTWDVRVQLSCCQIGVHFAKWVKSENKGGRKLTEIGAIKAEAFGAAAAPKFSFKGGETNAFWNIWFFVLRAPGAAARLGEGGALILQAGQDLLNMLRLIREFKKKMPAAAIQEFHHAAKGYLRKINQLAFLVKPKDHMLQEMSLRVAHMGSPQLYGNWHDESLNRLLRDVAGGAHALVHERRILTEFPRAHDNARAGRTTSSSKKRRVD